MSRHIILHNDTRELPLLVGFIEGVGREAGITEEELMSLQLAMEEAVVNIMQYAYEPGKRGDIEISAECEANTLLFNIEDCGAPFDPTDIPDADTTLAAEEREIGGLGIYIIRQIMDKVEYCRCDERNVLRLTKFIKR